MKRFISVLTVFVLLFCSLPTTLKTEAKAFYYEEMADMLNAMDILHGDGTGYNFNGMLTRAQFTKLAIAASTYKNSVPAATNTSPFSDVKYTHWAAGYIKAAITNSIVSGYPDSTFKPENHVKTEEAVTILLKMLGYTNADFGGEWPHGQMGIAKNIGLLDDVYTPVGGNLIRRDAIAMIYNMMGINTKEGVSYISKLGYSRTDDAVIIASSKEDTTIDSDKVYTSSGYFKINSKFNPEFVGRTGDMIVKQSNNEIVGFYPISQGISEYTVSSVTGEDIWLTGNGATRLLNIQGNTVVYDKTTKTTYSAVSSEIESGDKIRIVTNQDGYVSYLLLKLRENSAFENTDLKSYVISATLGSNIIVSENGENKTLVIPTDTTSYYDSAKTSYTALVSQVSPGDIINVVTDNSGKIRYVSVDTNQLMGPYTFSQGTTASSLGIPADAKIMKSGNTISFSGLKENDILYYSKTMNTAWVYSESKTGVIEKLSPNEDYPTSVTLAGVSYNIESAAALSALSTGGKYKSGDTVTILLGRSGGVADVLTPDFDEIYTVSAVLGSTVVVNDKGTNKNLTAPSNTVAYYDSSKTTFSSLTSMLKSGDIISVIRNSDGDIDYISVDTGLLDGPYTAGTSSIFTAFGIPSDATVLKGGSKVSESDIKANDIVYYSKTMNTVWVYSDKKTGIYQSASPNNDIPTSITLSGQTFNIESAAAFTKLSSGGVFPYGSTVTLLLGRNGEIADVISPATADTLYAYVISSGKAVYKNNSGSEYTSYNVTVATPDGHTYEYMTSRDYSTYVSNVVKITFDGSSAVLSLHENNDNISGVIDAQELKIGKTRVSRNVNIIDVKKKITNRDGGYLRTYLSRLDGINIYNSQVLYAGKNAEGEIDKLIIENVTGDVYSYGIITSNNLGGGGTMVSSNGSYILKGATHNFNGGFTVKARTPVKLDIVNNSVESVEELKAVDGKITSVNNTTTITNDSKETYYLSDSVDIYTHSLSLGYMLITMEEFKENFEEYSSIRAYYDKSMSTGGRVRIIIAEK